MKTRICLLILICMALIPVNGFAGFTETLPQGTFMTDIGFMMSTISSRWDDEAKLVPLIDPIERYEPGAGSQGTLKPHAQADLGVLAVQLHYGILDNLTFGFGVPIIIYTHIDPKFEWEEGDYQWNLGRSYSEKDFWQWAESMGQPKPEYWEGNEGVLGDIQLGLRYRLTDNNEWFTNNGLAIGLMLMGALPTGKQAEAEEVITAGTTSWELHFNGDFGVHVGIDKTFKESLDDRLILGLDLYYEWLLPHKYKTPTGEKNPLMLTYSPYVGKYYTVDGGDFSGFSFKTDIVPWKGPARATWLTKGNPEMAKSLPPLLTVTMQYTFTHLQQSDYESESDIWDWKMEKTWKRGYKNILGANVTLSLLRVGAPLMPYVTYRNLTWLPSKNCRAPNVFGFGTRALLKFW